MEDQSYQEWLQEREEQDKQEEIDNRIRENQVRWAKRFGKRGFVYFIEDPLGKIKIGQTKNFKKRLSNIATHYSSPPKVIAFFEVLDCNLAEKLLHEGFAHYRLRGEWFALPDIMKKFFVRGRCPGCAKHLVIEHGR